MPGEQRFEVLDVRHNLALIRFFRGDVPGALAAFAELPSAYADLGDPHLELVLDQADDPARGRALRRGGRRHRVGVGVGPAAAPGPGPSCSCMRAAARWAPGRPELALEDARAARRLFLRQQRDWWRTRADLVALQARIELGRGSRRAAVALADSLADDATEDAVLAHLLAGRELARSDPAAASAYLSRAAAGRHRGSPLSRTTAWLARALELEVGGRPRVLDAVGRGTRRAGRAPCVAGQSRAARPDGPARLGPRNPRRPARAAARPAGAGAVERPRPRRLPQPAGAGTPGRDHRRAARDDPWPVPPDRRRGGPRRAAGARARAGPARAGRPAGVGCDAGSRWSGHLGVGRGAGRAPR